VLSGLPGIIVSGGKCSDPGQPISPVAWSRISSRCVQSRSGSGLGFSGLTQGSPGEGSTPAFWASWLAVVLGFLTSATVGWCPSLWPRPFPSVAAVLLRLWTPLTLAHLVSSPFLNGLSSYERGKGSCSSRTLSSLVPQLGIEEFGPVVHPAVSSALPAERVMELWSWFHSHSRPNPSL